MRILTPTAASVAEATAALARGELVGMPTETVYGLAGSAFDGAAVARIFAAKERPVFDPLIVHLPAAGLATPGVVGPMATTQRQVAEALAARFWPGPLTLVLPRHARMPDLATSGLATVAVRRPRHPLAQALIEAAGPLAAPSANRFGRISPTTAADVAAELDGRGVELVLDGGACAVGVESTIVAIDENGLVSLLRPGGVATEELGPMTSAPSRGVAAPGMLPSHYAPRKPLILLPASVAALHAAPPKVPKRAGLLAFSDDAGDRFAMLTGALVVAEPLDGTDLFEAARGFFAALRRLDASDAEVLYAEPCPSSRGLGHAITDRLARAAHRG